ncbi:calcineurin-like phosphohydrolase [Planococcus antarcticus DSM 14505]|uniref:Calcineurin-like phosphohydrolase n=1 Tax=Planococcus antarcticus DSM 14505 TaxID=1185653 RepID=A0AA87LV00_9BACL|nr:metallophosphoesterase [Planococcus antarcticus]EIM06735.1 calcineurin-like phosphohydrolase [Planococcus antarcticus DSM 14505]
MKHIIRLVMAAAVLLLFMVRNAHSEKLVQKTIELPADKPFEPFKLLFIADVHRRVIQADLIDFPVDIVIIGGDLVEKGVPLERVAENVKRLMAHAPVYFVWGNNDREVDETSLRKIFDQSGVIVLDDQSVPLFGNEQLKLVGLDHFAYKPDGFGNAFKDVKDHDTVLFVSHTPFDFWKIKGAFSADLLLAGHTHGGQIRIGPFGLFKKGSMKVKKERIELISNGFGTTTLHLRLGAQAEYHVLTIRPKTKVVR